MKYPNARILVFTKAPIPGRCKTRLIPALGVEGAAQLHKQLVQKTLTTAANAELCPLELWCVEDTGHSFFTECAQRYPVTLHRQQGPDLGQRMYKAIQHSLIEAEQAIIIGTDCPSLTYEDLDEALTRLTEGDDCVLSPAYDGGYVMIGMSKAHQAPFEGVQWGEDSVLETTRQRLRQADLSWHELRYHHDIDRPEDLTSISGAETGLLSAACPTTTALAG